MINPILRKRIAKEGPHEVTVLRALCALLISVLFLVGCSEEPELSTPRAVKHELVRTIGFATVSDDYAYLEKALHPERLKYEQQEREYLTEQIAPWERQRRQIEAELNSFLVDEKTSVPIVRDGCEYYQALELGGQYPIYYRRCLGAASAEVLLDLNKLSVGSDYYALGNFATSPDQQLIAFTEDRVGAQQYRLRIRQLDTGTIVEVNNQAVSQYVAWSKDNDRLFYVVQGDSSRNQVVHQYELSTAQHTLVYMEPDPSFHLSVYQGRTGSVVVSSSSPTANELRVVRDDGSLQLVAKRRPGHQYRIRLLDDAMVILTNHRLGSREIALSTADGAGIESWQFLDFDYQGEVVDFEVKHSQLILRVRNKMAERLLLFDMRQGFIRELMRNNLGELRLHTALDSNSSVIRVVRTSLAMPDETVECSLSGERCHSLQVAAVPNYDSTSYRERRVWIAARDGAQVPVTLVFHKDTILGDNPLYIKVYGAYGISLSVEFVSRRLPLLKRGFVVALAHVRGGGELGSQWHHSGKLANKNNTFTDVVDVAQGLTGSGYGHADRVFLQGASAGGTAVAVAANESPELFAGIVAHVPFVDLLTTLADESLSLTKSDYLEWGDIIDPEMFQILRDYSPYQQVAIQAYPAMLVTAAENDSRVAAHEALKWMAKLRERNTGKALMLIDIDEDTGHLGASDQYQIRRRDSLEFAFILSTLESRK